MNENIFKQIQIYEVNTRIFCKENGCTLEELPESFFESSEYGMANYIWMMGVWKPSPKAVVIAKTHGGLLNDYHKVLPDLKDSDIIGSPYAILEYTPNPLVSSSLANIKVLKKKLEEDGKKLILDLQKSIEPKKERVFGKYNGQVWMSDDFNEPLEDFKEYMP